MTDGDAEGSRRHRLERQSAARRARRRRTALVLTAIVAGAAAVAGLTLAWRAIAAGALTATPLSPVLASSAPTGAVDAVAAAKAAAVEAARGDTITVIGVGDLLFDLAAGRLIAAQGGAAPLAKVATLLADADLTIANLEGPLSTRGTKVSGKPDNLIFEGPPKAVEGLTASGIDVVALANNHAMDYGGPALEDTLRTLDTAGVAHSGAGMNRADAWKPAIIERKGLKVAYLSFTQRIPDHFLPTATAPGVASGKDMRAVTAAIRAAKQGADRVIVSFHWGVEQSYDANAAQRRDGHAAIDAGADMVLSHHPHVMQGIEFYKGRLIAYSLGNFIFPYKTTEGRKSFILKASMGPDGVSDVSAVPVYLGEWGRPVPQTGSSAASILGKLKAVSAPLGTDVVIAGDVARIVPK